MSELFIMGGVVIDPEKKEKYEADVCVRDGVIAAIGRFLSRNLIDQTCV